MSRNINNEKLNNDISIEMREASLLIDEARALENKHTLSFIFLTDLHLDQNREEEIIAYKKSCNSIRKIVDNTKCEAVYFGGDNTHDIGTREALINNHQYVRDLLIDGLNVPLIMLKGNHDDKSINGRIDLTRPSECSPITFINDDELYDRYDKQNESNSSITMGESGLYGYMDYPKSKIRVFYLNSIDVPFKLSKNGNLKYPGQWKFAYRRGQLEFIGGALEKLPRGYQVLFISHICFDNNPVYETDVVINNDVLLEMLEAFREGKKFNKTNDDIDFGYDLHFSFKGKGIVIANLCGHNHLDYETIYNGINCLSTKKGHREINSDGAKANHYINYTAFDYIIIDPIKKEVNLKRYGLGRDRFFKY